MLQSTELLSVSSKKKRLTANIGTTARSEADGPQNGKRFFVQKPPKVRKNSCPGNWIYAKTAQSAQKKAIREK
jgi:hypothetical protein